MRSGKLTHRITFQVRAAGQGTMGQPVSNWTDVLSCWARVRGLNIKVTTAEEFKEKQFSPEVTHEVTVRNKSALDVITPNHRILFGTKVLDILLILPGERKLDPMVITCREHVFVTGDSQ
jgi:SPP1 family predicted phage head-tail adaptor